MCVLLIINDYQIFMLNAFIYSFPLNMIITIEVLEAHFFMFILMRIVYDLF